MTFMIWIPKQEQGCVKGTLRERIIKPLLQTASIETNDMMEGKVLPIIFLSSPSNAEEACSPETQWMYEVLMQKKNCTKEDYSPCLKDYWN